MTGQIILHCPTLMKVIHVSHEFFKSDTIRTHRGMREITPKQKAIAIAKDNGAYKLEIISEKKTVEIDLNDTKGSKTKKARSHRETRQSGVHQVAPQPSGADTQNVAGA